ncbi:hypothetical protein HHK36_020579 [Tetracentron sinense]|uniref:Isopenicillin N synthase-like Fe(2+) 2OG dioxygenase domain-containing protein n=1 Tax=Tetracentron sinense TaxID=13715 RepID=A0A834YZ90_TETSI|nr:hypothetical protein HHK36_020579 [Tetracentron sinense]
MEGDAEMLELFELNFSDLLVLSSSSPSSRVSSSLSSEEIERLDSISIAVMETLGPSGPGLLAITGVPKASELRKSLLPLARKLALLQNEDRRRILKEHSLGSDVPLKNLDRIVSSFAMQLKYVQDQELTSSGSSRKGDNSNITKEEHPDADNLNEFHDSEFENLGNIFKELGFCMMELGLFLAQLCDRAIGGEELEQSLLDSGTAKARLIHYHSALDSLVLKEEGRRKRSTKGPAKYQLPHGSRESEASILDVKTPPEGSKLETGGNEGRSGRTSLSSLWQQWHYDYGVFTVLTAPMFISPCHPLTRKEKDGFCISCDREHPPPDGHTYLQIFDPNKNIVSLVRSPPESVIVQVGESADILSKGKLRSTLHSVCKPEQLENLSRETFVVFLQPSWSKKFSIPEYLRESMVLNGQCSWAYNEESHLAERELHKVSQEIHKIVPPLSSRLKDGMTFADFSRETTRQYYGGSGGEKN